MTVGVLGMAFKANSDDSRESLSYKLSKILEVECKEVLRCYDFEEDIALPVVQEYSARFPDLRLVKNPY